MFACSLESDVVLPTRMRLCRNVPVLTTTLRAPKRRPSSASTVSRTTQSGRPLQFSKLTLLKSERSHRDFVGVKLDFGPTRCPQDEHRQATPGQVLLIPQVLVGGDVNVEAHGLRTLNQCTVLELSPPTFERRFYGMSVKGPP